MGLLITEDDAVEQKRLNDLEFDILKGKYDSKLLKIYYDQLVALNQTDRGRQVLSRITQIKPYDTQVRSLLVALCLNQEDYMAAMSEIEEILGVCAPDDGLLDAGLSVRDKINDIRKKRDMAGYVCISLCMIVKNEANGLGACLNAAKDLVDEIVVVDTGSTDRTIDVARIFGASIYEQKWSDDFSAARNLSLKKATCDWVLILDADEIIAKKDHQKLRQLVNAYNDHPAAISIETRNYTQIANTLGWQANEGQYPGYETGLGWFPSRKVRLFPRISGIRFSYPVHELVEPALRKTKISIVSCSVPIHHYGQLNETKNQTKAQKYFELGYAKLDQMGDDLSAIRELAVQAGKLEHWSEAIQIWRRFLEIQPDFAEAYVNIASAHWQMGDYDHALSQGYKAIELEPGLKEAHYNVGVSLLFKGRFQEAADVFHMILNQCKNYFAARFMLAAALACGGDLLNCQKHMRILETSPAAKALSIAIEDLAHRLRRNKMETYAATLEHAANSQHKDNSVTS